MFSTAEDNKIQRWELAGGKKTVLAGHDSWVGAWRRPPTARPCSAAVATAD